MFDDVERLARNLVAMNGILRDRSRTTDPARDEPGPDGGEGGDADLHLPEPLRLPDRRRRGEPAAAARTGYFAAWREAQQEQLELVRSAFAPVPVLTAPYFEREVVGDRRCSTGSAGEVFEDVRPGRDPARRALAGARHRQRPRDAARDVPFAEKGDRSLKKIGLEVIVRVGGQKRTIMLPPALAAYAASGARFEDGALRIVFEKR